MVSNVFLFIAVQKWYTQQDIAVGKGKSGKSLIQVWAPPAAERRKFLEWSQVAVFQSSVTRNMIIQENQVTFPPKEPW